MKFLLAFSFAILLSSGVSAQNRLTPEQLRAFRLHEIEEAIKEKSHPAPAPTLAAPTLAAPTLNPQAEAAEKGSSDQTEAFGEAKISTSTPESEVHAAINPVDTTNIVISPIHNGTTFGMPIYYTKNFGKTWAKSSFSPGPSVSGVSVTGGGDPVFAYDANGKLYLTWIDTYKWSYLSDTSHGAMYWASSTNGGQTWVRSKTGTISSSWSQISSGRLVKTTGFDDKQWVACDRSTSPYHNTLYVAWTKLGLDSAGIMLARKLPGVDSVEVPVRVSSPDLIKVQFSSIGVDAHGGVHVTFMGSLDLQNYAIYHAYSADGGMTFKPEVKIADADIPNNSADAMGDVLFGIRINGNYPCPHLSIDTANTGNLYMVWNALGSDQNLGNGTQIYFSRSIDNGATWSDTVRINNDPYSDVPIDHFYPSIAVNGHGTISVTWYDRREDPNNQIARYYMGQSANQGYSWINTPVASQPMDFSHVQDKDGGPTYGFGIGEYTQVLTTPYYTIPVWTDDRTNDGNLRIYAAFYPSDLIPAVKTLSDSLFIKIRDTANSNLSDVSIRIIADSLAYRVVDSLYRIQKTSGVQPLRVTSVEGGIELIDPYPNPAKSMIKTGFILSYGAHAQLLVTNILGETVASLFDGNSEAGERDFTFDASRLPNGVYYLNLESDLGFVRRAFSVTH